MGFAEGSGGGSVTGWAGPPASSGGTVSLRSGSVGGGQCRVAPDRRGTPQPVGTREPMRAIHVSQLQPGVVTETVTLKDGKETTAYRCPFISQGPMRITADGEQPALRYMYAHFVFTWPAGSTRVEIGHGTVERSMALWDDQPVPGEWCERSLVQFAQCWVRHHLARFRILGAEASRQVHIHGSGVEHVYRQRVEAVEPDAGIAGGVGAGGQDVDVIASFQGGR